MSIFFNWEKLTEDSAQIEQQICDFLHAQFQSIQLPEFISSLSVSNFKLGSVPPEVILKHFSDPFPEFYEADAELDADEAAEEDATTILHPPGEQHSDEDQPEKAVAIEVEKSLEEESGDGDTSLNYRLVDEESEVVDEIEKSPFDMQSFVEFKYNGDMQLGITAILLVNYPAPSFISLPLSIKVTNIDIHSLFIATSIKNRVHISVLSDVHDKNVIPSERVNVIKSMKIESEIGDSSDHGAMLRNVGKAEKFVIEQLRNVIRNELVWPSWLTIEL